MSLISSAEVKRIADLARLQLSEHEIKQATKDLGNVLNHFSQIQAIDTSNVPTSDDVTGLSNISRVDLAVDDLLCSTQALLDNAPQTHQGQIKVQAIFT
jgi:aspartyl-tRNA(Asn)/glutamyl-tRNA(Gln) amidotransferase subunit C